MPGSLWGPGIFVFPMWALWSSTHRYLSTTPTLGECVGKRRDGSVCVVAEYALHRRHELSRQDVRSRYRRLYRDVYVHNDVQLTAAVRARAAWLSTGATLAGLSGAAMVAAKWLDCDAPAEILRAERLSQSDMVAHSYRVLDDEVCLAAGHRGSGPLQVPRSWLPDLTVKSGSYGRNRGLSCPHRTRSRVQAAGARRRPRINRPGRADVGTPFSAITSPETIVAT